MSQSAYCPKQDDDLGRGRLASASCPRFIPMSAKVPIGNMESELSSPVEARFCTFSTSPTTPSESGMITFKMGQSSSTEDISNAFSDPRSRESGDGSFSSSSNNVIRRSKRKKLPLDPFPFSSLLSLSDTPPRIRRPSELVPLPQHIEKGGTNKTSLRDFFPQLASDVRPGLRHSCTVPSACNLLVQNEKTLSTNDLGAFCEESLDEDDTLSKLQMLSFSTTDNLGSDLKELVQKCRNAPTSLTFLQNSQNYANFSYQLSEYENHRTEFDEFVARVRLQSGCEED
ncbi:hypothetical protein L596_003614 [Steinernema carpocapsae]|uniref:Uncharacterized protein n=1 Tax=Steinernema carpocapsae TaxID=34508 RepID=A0A4U8UX55_STECR|nr:hypothetical protein L596_003614 [Steinernema carpocapsae]